MSFDARILTKLQVEYVDQTAFCPPSRRPVMAGYELEYDGRKRRTLVKELQDAGLLGGLTEDKGRYYILPAVHDTISPEKPDLIQMWVEYRKQVQYYRNHVRAVRWSSFSPAQKKYILEHQSEFRFLAGELHYWEMASATALNLKEIHPYTAELHDLNMTYARRDIEVVVTSDELVAFAKKDHRDRLVEYHYNRELFEGLKATGILPANAEPFFTVDAAPMFDMRCNFKDDPKEWPRQLRESIKSFQEKIRELATDLGKLIDLRDGIDDYGGWEKFMLSYRSFVESAIDRDLTAQAVKDESHDPT